MLNVSTTNFDTFCVLPDYVMPNSWKDSRHITDGSRYYLYSCHKFLLCLHFNDTLGNRWIGRGGPNNLAPSLTWPALDFHFWRYLKTLMYETPVETKQALVVLIQVAAGAQTKPLVAKHQFFILVDKEHFINGCLIWERGSLRKFLDTHQLSIIIEILPLHFLKVLSLSIYATLHPPEPWLEALAPVTVIQCTELPLVCWNHAFRC